MRVFLVGNPNVGKSVVFNRLTGLNIVVSNYPGTTVEIASGKMRIGEWTAEVIDLPGTYTLEPTCKAEEITVQVLGEMLPDDVIVNIVDSTNLERSLGLTLQLMKCRRPMVVALNLWDEAQHTGVQINSALLGERLGVPCVPMVALTGEGIKTLVDSLSRPRASRYEFEDARRWEEVGAIVNQVQILTHRHHTLLERLGDASLRPFTGAVIALLVLGLSFEAVSLIGEGLIGYISEPFFEKIWAPQMLQFSHLLGGSGLLHDLLIGKLADGKINYGESFGLLTTGLFVPLGAVLPYVFAFYLVLSLLEDSGYLPRLSVLVDRFLHVVGLHGMGVIPMLLGVGCNVPGMLSSRIMESGKERFICSTLIAIAVPCMAQIAMIVGLAGRYGAAALAVIFGTLFLVWIVLGMILKRTLRGESPELILDVPPYRIPYLRGLGKKVWSRLLFFLMEAMPFVLAGVLLVNLFYLLGVMDVIGRVFSPVIVNLLGLPRDAAGALVVGFLRKDVAVGMLAPLHLSFRQTVVACVVLALCFPCVATLAVMLMELKTARMLKASATMLATALVTGGLLNLTLWAVLE